MFALLTLLLAITRTWQCGIDSLPKVALTLQDRTVKTIKFQIPNFGVIDTEVSFKFGGGVHTNSLHIQFHTDDKWNRFSKKRVWNELGTAELETQTLNYQGIGFKKIICTRQVELSEGGCLGCV